MADPRSHAMLKNTLEISFTPDMLVKFKTRASAEGLRPGELAKMDTVVQVIDALERRSKIGPGNYALLKQMLMDIDAEKYVDDVKNAERAQGIFDEGLDSATGYVGNYDDGNQSTDTPIKSLYTSANSTDTPVRAQDKAQSSLQRQQPFDKDDAGVADQMLQWRTENSYNRGRGFVIIIRNFTKDRSGSEIDENNLRNVFGKTGLKYFMRKESVHDVSKEQLLEKLTSLRTYIQQREEDEEDEFCSLFVFISSHGDKDGIKSIKNEIVSFDEITSIFNGENMPSMIAKPKVFLFQACRGTQFGRGVSVDRDDGYVPTDEADPPHSSQHRQGNTEPLPSLSLKSIPINADMLLAHATSDGTKAWRNVEEGSWFINELCDTINKWHDKLHLLEILTKVNGLVAERSSSDEGAKQMPQQVSTLTKNFFL